MHDVSDTELGMFLGTFYALPGKTELPAASEQKRTPRTDAPAPVPAAPAAPAVKAQPHVLQNVFVGASELTPEQKDLFNKILSATRLTGFTADSSGISFRNSWISDDELASTASAGHRWIFIWADEQSRVAAGKPLFQIQSVGNAGCMFVPSLPELLNSEDLKRQLWQALKTQVMSVA